jgi:hypothetical protein
MDRKDLIEAAVDQIKRDLAAGDETAIWELLDRVEDTVLEAFLPEEMVK